ncbi:hypothetical protein R6Q57_001547 [Mikania cordata]
MKTVVGESSPRSIPVLEDKHDSNGPRVQAKMHDVTKPSMPRKTVSINDEVEYIEDYSSNNKRKKKKMMEQGPSMEIDGNEKKPLKSILKVGSKQYMMMK